MAMGKKLCFGANKGRPGGTSEACPDKGRSMGPLRISADGNGRGTDTRLDILDNLQGRTIEDGNLTTVWTHEDALQAIRGQADETRQ